MRTLDSYRIKSHIIIYTCTIANNYTTAADNYTTAVITNTYHGTGY